MTRKYADILSGAGFLVLALIFWSAGRELTGVSRIFPNLLELFLALGGLVLCILGLSKSLKEKACDESPVWSRVWMILVSSVLYAVAVPLIGFYVSSAIFLFVMAMILGKTWNLAHVKISVVFSVGLCALIYLVFKTLLLVPTPTGFLF
jgi:putative tricarboxylic transport membrane protein